MSVSTAFSSFPKLSRVFLYNWIETRKNVFSISFRKHRELNPSFILIIILFACAIITSTARASSVFLLSYRSATFSSRFRGCFVKVYYEC